MRSDSASQHIETTREDELGFIGAMLTELGEMATRRDAVFLTYLLGMAEQEASEILYGSRPKNIRPVTEGARTLVRRS